MAQPAHPKRVLELGMGIISKMTQCHCGLKIFCRPKVADTAYEYIYQRMEDARRDVRIVTIQSGEFNDPIACDLETVRLEDSSGTSSITQALSYVWGNPEIRLPIKLGKRSVSITVNLESALRHLRYEDRPRRMWIDALSINQADNIEKGHQVALMRQIYRGSAEVIVWLGASNEGELAFEVLSELVANPDQHLDLDLAPHLDEKLMDRSHIDTLLGLGDNDVWRRMWIVQECTMAQKLEFVWGSKSIKGATLLEALGHITRHGRSCCSKLIHSEEDHPLRPFFISDGNIKGRDFKDYRARFSASEIDLLDAMGTFRLQRAFDSRDKIYGLLGLAMGQYKDFLEPDYTLPVEQVYEAAAIQFVRRTAKFEHFSHIVQDRGVSIPSWIPDWRIPMDHDNFDAHWARTQDLDLYGASGSTRTVCNQSVPGKLVVEGIVVDIISTIGSELKNLSLDQINSTLDEWQQIAEAAKRPGKAQSPLWRVLMNDAVREWDVSVNGYRGKRLGGRDYGIQVEEWRELVRQGTDPRSTHFHLNNTLVNCTLNRSLVMSEKYGYIGLGPALVSVGDVIIILYGGNMCYILRNTGRFYQLVGGKSFITIAICRRTL
ncbi:MAG: hypothetical protein Q9215_003839 [Flavoplaca cf. flavocitrina]